MKTSKEIIPDTQKSKRAHKERITSIKMFRKLKYSFKISHISLPQLYYKIKIDAKDQKQ